MPKQRVIAGLDIGSSKVCLCVGDIIEGMTQILALAAYPNSGMRQGVVSDVSEVVSAVSGVLDEVEKTTGLTIEKVIVGIGGAHISSVQSRGVIAVSRADGEITPGDVERVVEAARAVALPPNREILHVIPQYYIVDGQEDIKDPVGMTGIRLETETHVIGASSAAIKNLSRCLFQTGTGIQNMVFSPLATAKALLSRKQKEAGVALVDLGAATTDLVVFEEGEVLYTNVLPLGSGHITNDIAIGLRISLEAAEKIKLAHASAFPEEVRDTEMIDLSDFDPTETEKVPRKYVAKIIAARLSEIFEKISGELKKIDRDGRLPAGIVLTGGGSKLSGLVTATKENLRLPASLTTPVLEFSGMVDKVSNPAYSNAVGLLLWGVDSVPREPILKLEGDRISQWMERTKTFFRQFLP